MRRYLTLLFFVLIGCLAQTSEARKIALLIGVDDYANAPSLRCCVNDANLLKSALMEIGFEEQDIQLIVTGGEDQSAPTKTVIEQKLAEIVSSAEPSDIVFVMFSGRGFQNGNQAYICPSDTDLDNPEETSISVAKILGDFSKCQAKLSWIVTDACRNKVETNHRGISVPTSPSLTVIDKSHEVVLFQSCSEGEECYEGGEKHVKNGFFTKILIDALSGKADCNLDGCLTLFEVCTWTANQTQLQVKETFNRVQRPTLTANSASDVVLFEIPNFSKAAALVEEAQKAIIDGNYSLAYKLFDAAIAIYPKVDSWKCERELAKKLSKRNKQSSDKDKDLLLLQEQ
ncbi:MAG: caspase family protein [Thermoguttaceae bacterium]|nr:caspase family protein [Thermoguttaceae bacterium]MBR6435686.1 caspase family protein [Thermoguttaceae bacterium]